MFNHSNQRQMELQESKNVLIYEQMGKIMADVSHISKSRENAQQKYKFRGIDDIYNELHNLFAKHKVTCFPKTLKTAREGKISNDGTKTINYTIVEVEFKFVAIDGSFDTCIMPGEAMDNGDKSTIKAMSSAHKTALLQVFMIPTEEQKDIEDDDYDVSPEPVNKELEEAYKNIRLGKKHIVWNQIKAKVFTEKQVDSLQTNILLSDKARNPLPINFMQRLKNGIKQGDIKIAYEQFTIYAYTQKEYEELKAYEFEISKKNELFV